MRVEGEGVREEREGVSEEREGVREEGEGQCKVCKHTEGERREEEDLVTRKVKCVKVTLSRLTTECLYPLI